MHGPQEQPNYFRKGNILRFPEPKVIATTLPFFKLPNKPAFLSSSSDIPPETYGKSHALPIIMDQDSFPHPMLT